MSRNRSQGRSLRRETDLRSGFTILELLVCLAVVGLLLALLIPAVQQTRAAARRTTCLNNLKQIGIGLQMFANDHKVFPTGQECMVRLSPYLESRDLWERWNNRELMRGYAVPWLACPADSFLRREDGAMSYAINEGSRFSLSVLPAGGVKDTRNGFRNARPARSVRYEATEPSWMTDGLSQTIAFSERLAPLPSDDVTPARSAHEPRRVRWFTATRHVGVDEEPDAIDQCRNHRLSQSIYASASIHAGHCEPYGHVLTPNLAQCVNGPDDFVYPPSDMVLVPASSQHQGGVNALVADGSARFVADSIASDVWRALGSIAESDRVTEF